MSGRVVRVRRAERAALRDGGIRPGRNLTGEFTKVLALRGRGGPSPDDVVVIDSKGNIAAITHSINAVMRGKTAIVVDGITIGDPGAVQRAQIAALTPGSRLPSPTEPGIAFRGAEPVLGFASMGSGLHHGTFQGLLNVLAFDMPVEEAIDTPDFLYSIIDPTTKVRHRLLLSPRVQSVMSTR